MLMPYFAKLSFTGAMVIRTLQGLISVSIMTFKTHIKSGYYIPLGFWKSCFISTVFCLGASYRTYCFFIICLWWLFFGNTFDISFIEFSLQAGLADGILLCWRCFFGIWHCLQLAGVQHIGRASKDIKRRIWLPQREYSGKNKCKIKSINWRFLIFKV